MENIKIGYIGLGCRGKDLLENIVLAQKEQVVAVCVFMKIAPGKERK